MKVITVISSKDNDGFRQLERSLKHFGYELEVLEHPFEFGGQMKHIYEWCKANWGTFLYTDGWDTFALAPIEELYRKWAKMQDAGCQMLLSAEKNCYPLRETADYYPKEKCRWRYVNGGGMIGTCEAFVKMYEDGTLDGTHEKNDQQWLAEQYIRSKGEHPEKFPRKNDVNIWLDTECQIFQTIAFENDYDFSRVIEQDDKYNVTGWTDRIRVKNNETGSLPIFHHGNAHTRMAKIYQLL